MKLEFDPRGNIMPYEKIELSFDEFQDFFIVSFEGLNEIRKEIFEDYRTYLNDFKEQVSEDFIQWIDGSYITTKANPRDIDFVMLIEQETFDRHERLIEDRFRRHKAKQEYGKVDAYTVKMYPQGHERYFVTEYDLVYWRGLFTETKRNRAKKKFPKGFIEIKFGEFKKSSHE